MVLRKLVVALIRQELLRFARWCFEGINDEIAAAMAKGSRFLSERHLVSSPPSHARLTHAHSLAGLCLSQNDSLIHFNQICMWLHWHFDLAGEFEKPDVGRSLEHSARSQCQGLIGVDSKLQYRYVLLSHGVISLFRVAGLHSVCR